MMRISRRESGVKFISIYQKENLPRGPAGVWPCCVLYYIPLLRLAKVTGFYFIGWGSFILPNEKWCIRRISNRVENTTIAQKVLMLCTLLIWVHTFFFTVPLHGLGQSVPASSTSRLWPRRFSFNYRSTCVRLHCQQVLSSYSEGVAGVGLRVPLIICSALPSPVLVCTTPCQQRPVMMTGKEGRNTTPGLGNFSNNKFS